MPARSPARQFVDAFDRAMSEPYADGIRGMLKAYAPPFPIDLLEGAAADIAPESAPSPWRVRWISLDGRERGTLDQRTIDPQAGNDHDSAEAIAAQLNRRFIGRYHYAGHARQPPPLIELP